MTTHRPAGAVATWASRPLPPAFRLRLALVATVGFGAGMAARLLGMGLDPAILDHYLVSWSRHGFVRRGLLGTLLQWAVGSSQGLALTAVAVSLLGAVALGVLLLALCRHLGDAAQRNTVLAAAATIYAQFGWDLGRQDMLGLPLLVGLGMLLRSGRCGLPAALALAAGGLLHEHVLLWGVVLVVLGALRGWTSWRSTMVPVTTAVVVGILLVVVGSFEGTAAEFMARLPDHAPRGVTAIGPAAQWTGGPADALAHLLFYFTLGPVLEVAALLVAVVTSFVGLRRRVNLPTAMLVVAPALALAVVGADYMRWSLWLVVQSGLVLALHRRLPGVERDRVLPTVLVLLVLGPPGHLFGFPYWRG